MLRNEETNDDKKKGDREQKLENAIELLPDRGLATCAEIAVPWVIH